MQEVKKCSRCGNQQVDEATAENDTEVIRCVDCMCGYKEPDKNTQESDYCGVNTTV